MLVEYRVVKRGVGEEVDEEGERGAHKTGAVEGEPTSIVAEVSAAHLARAAYIGGSRHCGGWSGSEESVEENVEE